VLNPALLFQAGSLIDESIIRNLNSSDIRNILVLSEIPVNLESPHNHRTCVKNILSRSVVSIISRVHRNPDLRRPSPESELIFHKMERPSGNFRSIVSLHRHFFLVNGAGLQCSTNLEAFLGHQTRSLEHRRNPNRATY